MLTQTEKEGKRNKEEMEQIENIKMEEFNPSTLKVH